MVPPGIPVERPPSVSPPIGMPMMATWLLPKASSRPTPWLDSVFPMAANSSQRNPQPGCSSAKVASAWRYAL